MLSHALPILHIASRIVAFLLGCLATYITLFMYEKEENRWEDRLVEFWMSMDDTAKSFREYSLAEAAVIGRLLFGDLSHMLGGDPGEPNFVFRILGWITSFLSVLLVIVSKLFAPIAARVIYALSRYKIVTNKKLLGSVSALLFVYAFNLETIGAKELLKLLG